MIKREELDVALETFNLLLVGVWITTLGSIPIAAFLLNIDLSERPSKSDLELNLWADHSIMKSGDLQSCGVITLGVRKSSLCRLSILMSTCSICTNKCDSGYISYEKGDSNVGRSSPNPQILEISSSIIQGHSTCERWPLRWPRKPRAKRSPPPKGHSR